MSINQSYFLVFSSHFDRDLGIDVGRLLLHNLAAGHQKIWLAYSSHKGGQNPEGFHSWGGMIPPQYRVPGLKHYTVNTNPEDSSRVRGVRGNFYRINPYKVITDKGGTRGAFGIHRDADAPGSLGCIVMSDNRFLQFESSMADLRSQSIAQIPLLAAYS